MNEFYGIHSSLLLSSEEEKVADLSREEKGKSDLSRGCHGLVADVTGSRHNGIWA